MKKSLLILLICFMGISLSFAEDRPVNEAKSLEEIELNESQKEISDILENLSELFIQVTAKKKMQCMKAMGHEDFCSCIAEKSPVGLSFFEYIVAVSNTKEELNYSNLSEEDRSMVDNARKAREECVSTVWSK